MPADAILRQRLCPPPATDAELLGLQGESYFDASFIDGEDAVAIVSAAFCRGLTARTVHETSGGWSCAEIRSERKGRYEPASDSTGTKAGAQSLDVLWCAGPGDARLRVLIENDATVETCGNAAPDYRNADFRCSSETPGFWGRIAFAEGSVLCHVTTDAASKEKRHDAYRLASSAERLEAWPDACDAALD